MLRLDPAHPPVWRTPTTLQFGADAGTLLTDPAPWQLRLVRELEHGVPPAALDPIATALGAPDGGGDALVKRLHRVLERARHPAPRVALMLPDGWPAEAMGWLADALSAGGATVTAPAELLGTRGVIAVVVASRVVEPRRVAGLMVHDIPHLPAVFTGTAVEVGPFVDPGRTACTTCIAQRRHDADPAWSAVAAQLAQGGIAPLDRGLVYEAGLAAARLIDDAARHPHRNSSPSVLLRPDHVHRMTRMHRPHAECRCRSLGGTATADDPAIPAPRTATAYARPA